MFWRARDLKPALVRPGAGDCFRCRILTHALAEGAVILTHDLDFGAILAATGGHAPSVVQIRAGDLSPSSIASQVIQALRQTADELARGALVTVDPARARVTLLPLNRDEG